MLVALAWLCTFAMFLRPRNERRTVPLLAWSAGWLFVGWTVLSYVYSFTRNYGLDEVLSTASLFLIFLWAARRMQDSDGIAAARMGAKSVIAAALIACLMGIVVYVCQPVNRFVGSFLDPRFHTDYWPNAWAQFLLLAWPLVLVLPVPSRSWGRIVRALILGTLTGFLLLSYSRGGLIAFGGQIVLLLLLEFLTHARSPALLVHRVRERGPSFLLEAIAVAVVAGSIFVGVNAVRSHVHDVQSVVEKVTFTSSEGASSITERAQFWGQAWALALERPLLGWGPYSFRFVQPHLQQEVLATSDHPHNVFLKFAAERGLPAAFFFLVIVFLPFLFAAPWRRGRMDPEGDGLRVAAVLSIGGVLAHNLIDYNLQFVGIALPFWILLGFLLGRPGWRVPFFGAPLPSIRSVRLLELTAASLLLLVAVKEGVELTRSSLGRHAEAAGQTEVALLWYDRAAGEWLSRDMHLSRAALLIGNDGRALEALDAIATYQGENAQDARGWRLLGEAQMRLGDPAAAVESFQTALGYGAYNDLGIVHGYVSALLAAERKPELDQKKDQIDALLWAYDDAIERNAHFIALSGNVEECIAVASLMASVYPKDEPRYDILAARVDRNARRERARLQARTPGILW